MHECKCQNECKSGQLQYIIDEAKKIIDDEDGHDKMWEFILWIAELNE